MSRFRAICDELTEVFEAKNADYGNSIFDQPMLVEDITPEKNVLCRLSDKLSRLKTLYANSGVAQVNDESIDDTIKDVINYFIILLMIRERQV